MRRRAPLLLRLLTLASLAAALLDLPIPAARPPALRIYVLDVSQSVQAADRVFPARTIAEIRDAVRADARAHVEPGDRAAAILFGSRPLIAVPPAPRDEFLRSWVALPKDLPSDLSHGSDLAAALLAARTLAGDTRPAEIALFTDGRARGSDLAPALASLARAGIPILAIAAGPLAPEDARIDRVQYGSSPGATFELQASRPTGGVLRMDDEPRRVEVDPAARAREATPAAASRLLWEPDPADAFPETDAWTLRRPRSFARPRTLLISPFGAASALAAVEGTDAVAAWTAPEPYDVVVLETLPARAVPPGGLDRLRRFVEDGGGLVLVGGPESYGPGGYADTALEEISPVWMRPNEAAAVVFVLDRSGSMAEPLDDGRSKLQAAVAAVEAGLAALGPPDRAGVIAFAGEPQVVIPLRPATDLPESLAELGAVMPHGPTRIAPALREAMRMLIAADAPRRHVVLVTDGETEETLRELRVAQREIEEARIGWTAAITSEAGWDRWSGNPRARRVWAAAELHDWIEETVAHASGSYLDSPAAGEFSSAPPSWLAEVGPLAPPARMHRADAKPEATVLIVADGHPALAIVRRGAGTVTALAAGFVENWATPPEWGRVASAAIGAAAGTNRGVHVEVDATVEAVRFAVRGESPSPVLAWTSDDGAYSGRSALAPVAPSAFELVWAPPAAGTYHFTIPGGPRWSFDVPYPPEWRSLGPDEAVLDRLCASTGGRRVRSWGELAPRRGDRPAGSAPGRTAYLLLALASLLAAEAAATFRPR